MPENKDTKPDFKPPDPSTLVSPWPLGTTATIRALAWPDYSSPKELEHVLSVAEPLFGRNDSCLCLRHDPSVDIPLDDAIAAIEQALTNHPSSKDLNILIIDDKIDRSDWPRVGLSAFCAIQSEASGKGQRAEFINAQKVEIVSIAINI